jgi:hypothetical protein
MKATVDGITYEGTEEEIRRIVENPPHRPEVTITCTEPWTLPCPRNRDGSPAVTGATNRPETGK